MEQSRHVFLISFLLLFFPRGQYTQSPCPEYFEYRSDDRGIYGLVHVYPRNPVSSITTTINFTVAAQLPSRYIGKLESLGEDLALIQQFNKGVPIDYRLLFPVTSPVPRITSITVNGDVICSGPGDSVRGESTVTSVGLRHTLYLQNPGTVYNNSPQKYSPKPATFVWGNQDLPSFDNNNPTWTNDNKIFVVNRIPENDRNPSQDSFDYSSLFNGPQTATIQTPPLTTTTPRPVQQTEPSRSQNHDECGTKDIERVPLVYEGMTYERGDWPWVVAVFTQKDVSISYVCAGTIISTLHVLTAAHCIYRRETTIRTEDVVVKAGVYNLKKAYGDDEIAVSRFLASAFKHEEFNPVTLANDIMLLKFTRPLEFNTYIKAACLWSGSPDINLIAGNIGVVTGWGVSEYDDVGKGTPRMVRMPIISTDKCRASKQEFHSLTSNTTLCAGDRNGAGPCLGDSGGGLYLPNKGHWSLRGIVSLSLQSMGERACNLQEYVVFTDSAQYIPWINDKMKTYKIAWNKLLCNHKELQLIGTLSGGQSFRWTYNKETDEWLGVFSKTVWKLRESDDGVLYTVVGSLMKESNENKLNNSNHKSDVFKSLLRNYFRLDVNLGDYYKDWSEKDDLFKVASQRFHGVRMLNQEPVENLFSFICSQNNHISRISSMVEKLCKHYGEEICNLEGVTYYAFPEVEKLAQPKVELELRKLGFGYRAKFIQKSAAQIVEWGGEDWFKGLQDMKYKDARRELMRLCGIGPKVADCICLMSLDHLEALPVDTHVYQIAAQNYLPHLRGKKSVTEKMYAEIGDHFRNLYGDLAGWAHTVLFCADLKKFQQNDDSAPDEAKPRKRKKK